jgi:hypothetical protein
MNISEMSDREKSIALARLAWSEGWHTDRDGRIIEYLFYGDDASWALWSSSFGTTLYDPSNMELAWRVLNWASTDDEIRRAFVGFWDNADLWQVDPAEAQRAWLDTVLELAVEAGIATRGNDEH